MLSNDDLENLLHQPGVSNHDRVLFCLALDPLQTRPLSEVRTIAVNAGWRGAKDANLSQYLNRAKGLAINTPAGWKLTDDGKSYVATRTPRPQAALPTALTKALRGHLVKIKNDQTREFIEEAIRAAEAQLRRSAVVLSWVGAVAVLYDFVVAHRLTDFNAEASRRNAKWRAATTSDDLGKMDEYEFLQTLAAISIIGKNVKNELEGCLKLRNGCGHPTSLQIADAKVAAHIETLLQNVFEKF